MNPFQHTLLQCPLASNLSPVCYAKGDSAASNHYIREEDSEVCQNIIEENGPPVGLPNAATITSTKAAHLPISQNLPSHAQKARILPHLKSASLISLGQLADGGCMSILTKDKLSVINEDTCIANI